MAGKGRQPARSGRNPVPPVRTPCNDPKMQHHQLVGDGGMPCPLCDLSSLATTDRYVEHELCIYTSNSHWKAEQQAEVVLPGSGIIIPRAHKRTPFDLSPEEWAATSTLLAEVKRAIDAEFAPDGYNVGWNVERAGGQEVAHAHLHVIPRYSDELFVGRGIRWWLKLPENLAPRFRHDG